MRERILPYFQVGKEIGGNQERLTDPWMHLGGCGAVTACDISAWLTFYRGKDLVPVPCDAAGRSFAWRDYARFTQIMKPYLKPRMTGINRLDIYTEGFGRYLADRGAAGIRLEEYPCRVPWEVAAARLEDWLDGGAPVPMLVLNNQDPALKDFVWHWFILAGIRTEEPEGGTAGTGTAESGAAENEAFEAPGGRGRTLVQVVSYGETVWLDFRKLWESGYEDRGGLVFVHTEDETKRKGEEG